MAKSYREVPKIDEQALLYSIADESYKAEHPAPVPQITSTDNNAISKSDVESNNSEAIEVTGNSKKTNGKQHKLALEKFRQQFMQSPKIENRKPVFISEAIRNDLDRTFRLFGERGSSVSGLN